MRDALARAAELCHVPLGGAERCSSPPVPLGRGTLVLVLGDARATLSALPAQARADAVFLDPFSRRVEPELWDERFLAALAARMEPQAWLSTYSASLAVRAGLARVGLRVGLGGPVGRKRAGTLATRAGEPPPLDARTRARLARRLERGL